MQALPVVLLKLKLLSKERTMSEEIRVKVSDAQMKEISLSHRTCKVAEEMVANVVMEVSERVAKERDDLWNQIFKLGGENVSRGTHQGAIEWVSQEIVFVPYKRA